MTRELTIDGQAVDLLPDTDITLEYVSNFFGEPGKINLPRSYTVRIPRTARNAAILDDPGMPGHESSATRRFLSARFYRNGIDLLGETKAYIMRTSPNGYEIALVWNALDALQTLSQSDATLNDLPNLPVLQWIGANGVTPNYVGGTDGALFAWYNSGLGAMRYPAVPTSTHPSMEVANLLDRILTEAGVPYTLSDAAQEALSDLAVLAAPNHVPDRVMETESGSVADSATLEKYTINGKQVTRLMLKYWSKGWDAPEVFGDLVMAAANAGAVLETGDNNKHRVILNLRAPAGVDLSDAAVIIKGVTYDDAMNVTDQEELVRTYFRQDSSGWYATFDDEINLSGWPRYAVTQSIDQLIDAELTPYDPSLPVFAAFRIHESIDISKDNRFPISGNLPDIKKWDFVKACMALLGLVPVVQHGTLLLTTMEEMFNDWQAYDWTARVDMTEAPSEVKYMLDGWAQSNLITFQDDGQLGFSTEAQLKVLDSTLTERRDYYSLPFAASRESDAVHYSVKDDDSVDDVDISPRVFRVTQGTHGQTLTFSEDLYGDGLVTSRYARLQNVVHKPVLLTAHIRLNELDLASLDLTRPVYLGQYGRYYAILKIQTSDTDLCKVELIQLP